MNNVNIKVLVVLILGMAGAIIYLILQAKKWQSELTDMRAQLAGQFNNTEGLASDKSQFIAKEPIGFKTSSIKKDGGSIDGKA